MAEDRIFKSAGFGFIIGVFCASIWSIGISGVIWVGVVGLSFLLSGIFLKKERIISLSIAIFFLAGSAGILRFYMKDTHEPKHTLDNFVGEEVSIEGVIQTEVENRESNQRIILTGEKLSYLGNDYPIDQKILVTTDFFPEYFYGDRIIASGKIKTPENFTTDIGKTFDYKDYLMKDSIYYTMSFADAQFINDGEGGFVKSRILSLKKHFLENIERVIPAPASGLMAGLLLGVKGSLGDKLHQAFIDTGLVHIIVLSGYNVTIIAEAVIKTLAFASVTAGIYAGAVFIFLFAIMTGGGATIIRASIMALLALLARITGRGYEITRALLVAGVVMVFQNPYVLVFDISFQLSFLATLGLIYVTPVFEKWFQKLPTVFAIREITSATFATQAFVLPFLLYKIGNLSVIAPITNVLVLSFVPATMFYGFLTGLVGFVSTVLSMPFGFIAFALLKYEITVVTLFARLPFASFTISRFPLIAMIICYIAIGYGLYRFYNKKDAKKNS